RRPRESSAQALDDAEVALGAVAERLQGRLVVRRLVRGERLVHVVELDDDYALLHAELVGLGRRAAHDEPAARLLDRRRGELGVGGPFFLVADLAVGDDEITLGAHGSSSETHRNNNAQTAARGG